MRGFQSCIGLILTTGRGLLLLLALLLLPSVASAENYSWRTNYNSVNYDGSTALASCSKMVNVYFSGYTPSITVVNGSTRCNWRNSDGIGSFVSVFRYGDSCPSGTTYTVSTDSCDAPVNPCADKAEQPLTFKKDYTKEEYANYTSPGEYGSEGGCRIKYDTYQCGAAADGTGACWGLASYTGEESEGGTPIFSGCPPGPLCPEPVVKFDSSKDSSCSAKTYTGNGASQYQCVSNEAISQPGAMSCGTANGQVVCTAIKPTPTKTETTVTTTVDEQENPDGSKETVTTTDTNKTTCKGASGDGCETTTTTSTTTTTTNPDGTPGPETVECSGPDCEDAAKPEEEEEGPESVVSGDGSCDATPSCEGDAIQCAILRQSHKTRCELEDFHDLSADKVAAATSSLDSEFSGADYSPLSAGAEGTFNLAGMLDTSRSINASCPSLPDIVFTINGQTKAFSFSTWMAELCKYAGWFSYLLVAFAMRGAAEIVAGGFK